MRNYRRPSRLSLGASPPFWMSTVQISPDKSGSEMGESGPVDAFSTSQRSIWHAPFANGWSTDGVSQRGFNLKTSNWKITLKIDTGELNQFLVETDLEAKIWIIFHLEWLIELPAWTIKVYAKKRRKWSLLLKFTRSKLVNHRRIPNAVWWYQKSVNIEKTVSELPTGAFHHFNQRVRSDQWG